MASAFSGNVPEKVSGDGSEKLELRLIKSAGGRTNKVASWILNELDFRVSLGAEFMLVGDFRGAAAEYCNVIALAPWYADAYDLRHDALTNAKRGCSEDAAKTLHELIVLNAQQGAANGAYLTGAEKFV